MILSGLPDVTALHVVCIVIISSIAQARGYPELTPAIRRGVRSVVWCLAKTRNKEKPRLLYRIVPLKLR